MNIDVVNGDSLAEPDIDALAQAVYLSGPKEFDYIFGRGAVSFISYCWQKDTLFGARYHTLVQCEQDIAGIMAAYTFREYIILYIKTAVCILRFFPINQAMICSYRGIKLKRLMRFPAMRSLYLAHISVKRKYRRVGMATELLNKTIDIAGDRRLGKLALDVRQDNTDAISLYEKYGYKVKAVIKATQKEQDYQLCNMRRMYLLAEFAN